jgi:DNA-directed RNA polymerase subunit RPC12/RpoP
MQRQKGRNHVHSFAIGSMNKQPYFLGCPACGHQRFILPIAKRYRCSLCGAALRVRTKGSAFIEWAVVSPLSLLIYWCAAAIFIRYGLDRDAGQRWGILVAFIVSLPIYGALRPFIVSVQVEESGPASGFLKGEKAAHPPLKDKADPPATFQAHR